MSHKVYASLFGLLIRRFAPLASLLMLALGIGLPAPSSAADITFEDVCGLSTTINCWGFESENDMYYVWPQGTSCDDDPFLKNHPNGWNGFGQDRALTKGNTTANVDNAAGQCVYPKRDASYAASGAYSLKFTMLSQSGPLTSSAWIPVFKRFGEPPNSTFARFGKGGEFWVRFDMRQSETLLTNDIQAVSGGFTGIKRVIVHGHASSSSLEETINDGWQRRVPQMYSDSGNENYGVQDFIGCTARFPDVESSYPEPPCRKYKANVWRSYQVHVIVADNETKDNGIVELYLDDEPDPIIRVLNSRMSGLNQDEPYTEDAVWDAVTNGYGKLTFTLFSTNKEPSQVHPEAYMWIDNVVVSHTRVPAFGASDTGGSEPAPPPPTGGDGTAIGDLAASMKAGDWAYLPTQNMDAVISNTGGANNNIFSYSEEGMWNPSTREFYFLGGDHYGSPQRFVKYKGDTNGWEVNSHPWWMSTEVNPDHGYDYMAIDIAKSYFFYETFRYDINTGSWTELTRNNYPGFGRAHMASEYFPGMGLVHIGDGGVFLLEDGANAWQTISPTGSLPFAQDGGLSPVSEYNPVHNVMIFGGGHGSLNLYKLDANRKVTAIANPPDEIRTWDVVFTVDPVSGDMLMFRDRKGWVYDVVSDSWSVLPNPDPFYWYVDVQELPAYGVIASPLAEYGVTMFARYNGNGSRVFLYKHASGGTAGDKLAPASPSDVTVN